MCVCGVVFLTVSMHRLAHYQTKETHPHKASESEIKHEGDKTATVMEFSMYVCSQRCICAHTYKLMSDM